MERLAIVVEGRTEAEFVNQVLAVHLLAKDVLAIPIALHGNVSLPRLSARMADEVWNFDRVTSLVDFYGFRDKGSASVTDLERQIHQAVMARLRRPVDESRIISYVQQYEFEGLLFSNAGAFNSLPGVTESIVARLAEIRADFTSPEKINDSESTAPSKRIAKMIPEYNKVVHGPLVAMSIGLLAIRGECPRFHQWVERLESLG